MFSKSAPLIYVASCSVVFKVSEFCTLGMYVSVAGKRLVCLSFGKNELTFAKFFLPFACSLYQADIEGCLF